MKKNFLLISLIFLPVIMFSQSFKVTDNYFRINATRQDPLYTKYSPTISRTTFPEPMVYKMNYYSDSCLVSYSGDRGGTMFSAWKIDDVIISKTADYFKKPVVIYSFPDMMIMEYQPVMGIHVRETFLAYSSSFSLVDMEVNNTDAQVHEVSVFPILYFGDDSVKITENYKGNNGILFKRNMIQQNCTNGFETIRPGKVTEFFTGAPQILSNEYYEGSPEYFYKSLFTGIPMEEQPEYQGMKKSSSNILILHQKKLMRPHETTSFRYMRGIQSDKEDPGTLVSDAEILKNCFLRTFFEDNLMLFLNVQKIKFENPDDKLLYLSSLNLARGSLHPSSGNILYNYCSSKNESASPNKEQQMLKEASGLMGYIYVDQKSAENAFRVFFKSENLQKPESPDEFPFYNWIGLEMYKVSGNKQFLREVYAFGENYIRGLVGKNNNEFKENPGVTFLIIKEENCLSRMAKELGKTAESIAWTKKASVLYTTNEQKMWDDSSGFLPLWTCNISKEHAARLVNNLIDSAQFCRKLGIPDISAEELLKNPVTRQTNNEKYNVGIMKNYMVYLGLLNCGYKNIANRLSTKIKLCVSAQLSKNHDFWEFYNPDTYTASGNNNYFPDSVLAKILIEENIK